MVLHSGPEEHLLVDDPTFRQEEDCILDRSGAMVVHTNAVWPVKCLSNI
jgi:hypothetical protein